MSVIDKKFWCVWEWLGSLGWHTDGTIRRGRQLVGRYYTVDRLSDEDLANIRKFWPHAERWKSQSQYAPEQKYPVVFVPSKAELARKKNARKNERTDYGT